MRPRTPRAAFRTARGLCALLLVVGVSAVSGGCGGQEPDRPAAADRSTWKTTFEAAMDALYRRDYAAMQRLLSPEGREILEADLRLLSKHFNDPLEGPRVLALVRSHWPEVPDALIESVRGGNLTDAWTLVLRTMAPPGVRPQQAGLYVEQGQEHRKLLKYRYGDGPGKEQNIFLIRIRGQWYVDKIELAKG